MNSIVKYYEAQSRPPTVIQEVVIKVMLEAIGMPLPIPRVDQMTFGEAAEIIKYLNKLYKPKQ